MSLRILRAASFRALLDHLERDLREGCRTDPFLPRWIVTPTSTLAADLRIRLASGSDSEAVTAVRVLPLTQLVQRLIQFSFAVKPVAESTLLGLLTHEMVSRLETGSAIGALSETPGGSSLLMPVFRDLADAGFGPDGPRLILDGIEPGELSQLAREVLQFFGIWAEAVEGLGIAWQPFLHRSLNDRLGEPPEGWVLRSMSAEGDQPAELFVYGFYDFTDLNLGTIEALARRMRVDLLLPGAESVGPGKTLPAFRYVEEAIESILIRMPSATIEMLPARPQPSTQFFLETFPEGRIGAQPDFLTIRKAAGIDAEALAAAVKVREWLDQAADLQPQEILIVAPDAGRYQVSLKRVFAEFGLPLNPLDLETAQNIEARPLQLLERLWRDQASTEWVLSYLRDYPEVARRKEVDLDSFETKLRSLRLYGGMAWGSLDDCLRETPESVAALCEPFSESERELVGEIRRLWADPGGSGGELSGEDMTDWIARLSEWLPDPDLLAGTAAEIQDFYRLVPGAVMTREMVFRTLLENSVPPRRSGSPVQAGVRFTTLMRARGLVARRTILLGMAANQFPPSFEDEPLLSDADRVGVSRAALALGHKFPVKSRILQEMGLLFQLTNSGCEAVHWVIPECDENGKAVATSPWLSRYLNAWAGGRRHSDSHVPEPEPVQRVPRSPLEQAEWLLRLDPRQGRFMPPAYGACLHARLSRLSLGAEYDHLVQSLQRREVEDAWNGSIPAAALANLARRDRFSVTELEVLARCPFRFWSSALAGIAGVDPLVWEGELSPLDRGQLVHHCLEWLVRTCLEDAGNFQQVPDLVEEATRESGFLGAEVRRRLLFLPPVFRKSALREMGVLVRAYIESAADHWGAEVQPLRLEVKIRRSFPGFGDRRVSGVLDRIDRRGQAIWIVDYKTARSPFRGRAEESILLKLGFISQPILYPWLCEELGSGWEPSGFSFVYLREDPPREVELRLLPEAEEFLSQLAGFLRSGAYPLLSSRTYDSLGLSEAVSCLGCELSSLCRRFEPGTEARGVQLLQTATPGRHEALLKIAGGESAAE
ncbi:MAG: PD-(D/E)XK nuclease family protein [Acidobacteriota bacterium]